jgi:hypothetical protein
MSINRVISGSTKKQQNMQSHDRINCLKIDKRHQWVKRMTKQNNIKTPGTYNKNGLRRINKKLTTIINGEIYHKDVGASIATMILTSPNKKWKKDKIANYLT